MKKNRQLVYGFCRSNESITISLCVDARIPQNKIFIDIASNRSIYLDRVKNLWDMPLQEIDKIENWGAVPSSFALEDISSEWVFKKINPQDLILYSNLEFKTPLYFELLEDN